MSPEKQRIAIAMACGWIIANPENDRPDYRHWTPPGCVAKPNHMYGDKPPNYLADLNACHEMEQVLTHDQHIDYMEWLGLCSDDYGHKVWAYVHATAAERCKAFLRTLGLWEEGAQ